jgi:hypothetical protein
MPVEAKLTARHPASCIPLFGSPGDDAGEKVSAFSCVDGWAVDQLLHKDFRAGAVESALTML